MNSSLEELREKKGVASVKKCGIPGVSYYVAAEGKRLKLIRVYWLKNLRDEYEWVGESENEVDPAFALLKKKHK